MSEEIVLEVADLHKTYRIGFMRKRVEAVRGVSFQVRKGEIFGVLGPNGAGKTSTIKTALRLIYPTRGEVKLFGESRWTRDTMARVGYLPENPYVYQYLKAEEFLQLCGQLNGLPRKERSSRVHEMIERVGLGHARDRRIGKFSKGMMQRVGLAQALLHDPEMLILDEPMSGLDPIGRKQVREVIQEEHRKGKTIIFTSHILTDVEMLCDRVVIINAGQVSAEGSLEDLLDTDSGGVEITLSFVPETLLEKYQKQYAKFRRLRQGCSFMVNGDPSPTLRALVNDGARIEQVRPVRDSLEDLFVREADRSLQNLQSIQAEDPQEEAEIQGEES